MKPAMPHVEAQKPEGQREVLRTEQVTTVSVIILNYNGREDLSICLESLEKLDFPGDRLEIIVIDNGSTDGSAEMITSRFPKVRLIENKENLGFSVAANQGAGLANGAFLAFLNNDMRVEKDWLGTLVESIGAETDIACAGSIVMGWDGKDIQFSGRSDDLFSLGLIPSSESLKHSVTSRGDPFIIFASGGAMLFRADAFRQLGGFDPDYFMYHEDVDLGLRLWLRGYRCVLSLQSVVFHKGGASSGKLPRPFVEVMMLKNMLVTMVKDLELGSLEKILPPLFYFLLDRSRYWPPGREALERALQDFQSVLGRSLDKRKEIQQSRVRPDTEIFSQYGQPFDFLLSREKYRVPGDRIRDQHPLEQVEPPDLKAIGTTIAEWMQAAHFSYERSTFEELLQKENQLNERDLQVRAQLAQLHELRGKLHDQMGQIQGLSAELAEIHSSKAWSAITTYRRMRAAPAVVAMRMRSYVVRTSRNGLRLMRRYGIRVIVREILNRAYQLVLLPLRERAGERALVPLLGRLGLSAEPAMVLSRARETLPASRYARMLDDLLKIDEAAAAPTPDKEAFPIIRASELPVPAGTRPRRRILFITSQFPSPFHGGGNRVLNFIKHLSRTNDIYLASAFSDPEDLPALQAAAPYCRSVFRISPWKLSEMKAEIRKWLGGQTFDIVHYEWPRSLQNYDPGFGRHHIFTYMEAVSLRLLMDVNSLPADSEEWVGKVAELIEAVRLEIVDTEPLDARIAVTTKDAEFLKDLNPRQEYTVLNHGLTFADFVLPEVEPEPQTLVFVGNYLHYPNVDAMNYFFGGIWERVCREVPGVRMYIVGTNPTPALLALGDREGITVTGSVPDVRSYIQKASVCVAPLISGAGLRGKVIEYAALRRTFVATSIATTDLAFKDGRDYLCADTPDEFSEKVIDLLRNPELAAEMGSGAYKTALENYDTGRLTDFLNRVYDRLDKRS